MNCAIHKDTMLVRMIIENREGIFCSKCQANYILKKEEKQRKERYIQAINKEYEENRRKIELEFYKLSPFRKLFTRKINEKKNEKLNEIMNEKSLKLANYTPVDIESLLQQYEKRIIIESNHQIKLKEERQRIRLEEIKQKAKLEEQLKSKRKEKLRKSSRFETIQRMDGYEFEKFTAEMLIELGFKDVLVTKRTGDFGVDVLGIDPKNNKTAIQCKRNADTNKVGLSAIQEIHTAKSLENCSRAIVITTSSFTSSAITAAKKLNIELWDGVYLQTLINDAFK